MNTTVKSLFAQFCKVYDLKTSATCRHEDPSQTDFYSNEFIKLDYAPIYGGYRLDIVEKGTGQRFFDGAARMPAKEINAYLRGLIAAKNKYCFEGIVNEK